MTDFRRVARQLEADQKLTMSRTPRVLHELVETLLIISGEMNASSASNFAEETTSGTIIVDHNKYCAVSMPCIPSVAEHCKTRDSVRFVALRNVHAHKMSIKLSERFKYRLGHLWKPVTSTAATWSADDDADTLSRN